ncbi:fungal-specific transcription factor domain-containing protein [Ilyonectria sp. MPI-CAGE-AT-0026]|nr:fungal-specific transcription factor domain-containing protein [Ilyonectria sp. MPI-CAGE-AT-0026]
MSSQQRSRRTRDGCWTCRSRKKKCDSVVFPCNNCTRLGIACERDTRLVWEDDTRRAGMKRRGPPKPSTHPKQHQESVSTRSKSSQRPEETEEKFTSLSNIPATNGTIEAVVRITSHHSTSRLRSISAWPFDLDEIEHRLLDHYIQRFSRTYPTCSGPTNPFLRILLPLSMQSRTVLDTLLALSGVQSWENGSFAYPSMMLKLRQRALRGCVELITSLADHAQPEDHILAQASIIDPTAQTMTAEVGITHTDNFMRLLASCVLLMLYEKLAGEGEKNGSPHLQFFARTVPNRLVLAIATESAANTNSTDNPSHDAFQFLSNLFLYNDLVQSTSLGTPTLSKFYLGETPLDHLDGSYDRRQLGCGQSVGRFYFPHLIARISTGDRGVTDADIAAWDGRLDWFPSFALDPQEKRHFHERLPVSDRAIVLEPQFRQLGDFTRPSEWKEQGLISELYRVAATVYRKQYAVRHQTTVSDVISSKMDDQDGFMGNLPSWAAQLIDILPLGSLFENALLWPIGIVAKELTADHPEERTCIMTKLGSLEKRFKMKNFYCVKQSLVKSWMMKDMGLAYEDNEAILCG